MKRQGLTLVFLGEQVRARRTQLGLTLDQLAARAGVHKSVLSRVENARYAPNANACLAIARALGVTYSWLTTGEE